MAKKGKTPSLIGGGAGATRFVSARGPRKCSRCGARIGKGTNSVEVARPGTMGRRTYCKNCYAQIITKSEEDLAKLKVKVRKL